MPRHAHRRPRRAPRRKAKKSMKKTAYPDAHSFKFMQGNTVIFSSGASGNAGGPLGTGQILLSTNPVKSANSLWSTTGAFSFNINVPQYALMAQYWDRVKLNKITIRVIPECNVADVQGPSIVPVMRFVKDYDDNIVPPNVAWVWARRGKEYRCDKPFTLTLTPKIATPFNGGAGAQGFIPGAVYSGLVRPSTWVNTTQASNLPYFGIKFGLKDFTGNSSNNNIIRFEVTYYLTFKEQFNPTASMTLADLHLPMPGQYKGDTYLVSDNSGNVYDQSGNLMFVPDASGNEVPYVPEPPV